MGSELLELKKIPFEVKKRYEKIDLIADYNSIQGYILSKEMINGVRNVEHWEVFVNMTAVEFNSFLSFIKDVINCNFFFTVGKKNTKTEEVNFYKLLTLCAVFNNYMCKPFVKTIKKNCLQGQMNSKALFFELFGKYLVSNDIKNFNTIIDLFIYDRFDVNTSRDRIIMPYDIFNSYEDYHCLISILSGENIRKVNYSGIKISKKESYFFHSANNLIKMDKGDLYFKKRIIASKFAMYCRENLSHVSVFLNSIRGFKYCVKDFEETIDFWLKVFKIIQKDNIFIDDIEPCVHYLEYQLLRNKDFPLKGKTLASISRDMELWHYQLNKKKEIDEELITWGKKEDGELKEIAFKNKIYIYKRFLSSLELYSDGQKNEHCVYVYKEDCKTEETEIWTIFEKDNKRSTTIRVENNVVVEARTKYNEIDHYVEEHILPIFAQKQKFKINL